MVGTASAMLPPPPVADNPAAGGQIPFRRATVERVFQLPSESAVAFTAGTQLFDRTVDGSGFIYGLMLRASATAAANTALVNFAEDAPFNVYDNVTLHDTNGDVLNLTGWALYVANLINHDYAYRDPSFNPFVTNYNLVTGSGANAGTFAVTMRVPVAVHRRSLVGALGNQDRSIIYFIRTVLAAQATLWPTVPTTVPSVTIEKHVESYSVPLPNAPTPNAPAQGQRPAFYGTINQHVRTLSEAAPNPSSTVNHYLRRIGNTIRWVAICVRFNGVRATFQSNLPSLLTFKIGDETLYAETTQYRQQRNWEQFGVQIPNGLIIYPFNADFWPGAGGERGMDWLWSQVVQNAQIQIAYGSGGGSTANTLEFITSDMIVRTPQPVVA